MLPSLPAAARWLSPYRCGGIGLTPGGLCAQGLPIACLTGRQHSLRLACLTTLRRGVCAADQRHWRETVVSDCEAKDSE